MYEVNATEEGGMMLWKFFAVLCNHLCFIKENLVLIKQSYVTRRSKYIFLCIKIHSLNIINCLSAAEMLRYAVSDFLGGRRMLMYNELVPGRWCWDEKGRVSFVFCHHSSPAETPETAWCPCVRKNNNPIRSLSYFIHCQTMLYAPPVACVPGESDCQTKADRQ